MGFCYLFVSVISLFSSGVTLLKINIGEANEKTTENLNIFPPYLFTILSLRWFASNLNFTYINTLLKSIGYELKMINCHWYSFYNFLCSFNALKGPTPTF